MQVELDSFFDVIAEVCVASAVLLVFWLERKRCQRGHKCKGEKKFKSVNEASCEVCKRLESDLLSGGPKRALSTWRTLGSGEALSAEALRIVVQAFVEEEPQSSVSEICHRMIHHRKLCTLETVTSLADIMARAGQTKMMEEFLDHMRQNRIISESDRINDILLGGFAFAGQVEKVRDLMSRSYSNGRRPSPRGYCLMIKGFLKNNMTNEALEQIKAMHSEGLLVPSFAVTKVCRVASDTEDCMRLIEVIENNSIPVSSPDMTILMKDCQKREDLNAAFRVEKIAQLSRIPLMLQAYDAFLMLCVGHGDAYAFKLFEEMQKVGMPSHGLCMGLIARCPEAKFYRFAEMIVDHLRKSNEMSIQAYIALMKAYANCGMYNKACDLYAQIVQEGLQPDSVMYGCLMNFAVACGRTELAQELSRVAPHLDIHKYMSLIKAAGRDKDIGRAFRVVDEMKANGVNVDITAYSCVLDACVQVGDMQRARGLLKEMQEMGSLDVVAYNTLLKGYCKSGDSEAAKSLLSQMDAAGVRPNDVSFNSLINATAATGNFKEAWSLVEKMESRGVRIGNYTMSILMKVLKKARFPHSKDVAKAFTLLDRSGVDVFSDEVLLNVVLDACTRHRQLARLEILFSRCMKSKLTPSMHTTGLLIKASGMLKRIETARELWKDFVETRKQAPNDYSLGYMLDALVSNDCLDEAIDLLNKWESKVAPSTYLYSTILKGLANNKKSGQITVVYEEMKEKASKMMYP